MGGQKLQYLLHQTLVCQLCIPVDSLKPSCLHVHSSARECTPRHLAEMYILLHQQHGQLHHLFLTLKALVTTIVVCFVICL